MIHVSLPSRHLIISVKIGKVLFKLHTKKFSDLIDDRRKTESKNKNVEVKKKTNNNLV